MVSYGQNGWANGMFHPYLIPWSPVLGGQYPLNSQMTWHAFFFLLQESVKKSVKENDLASLQKVYADYSAK